MELSPWTEGGDANLPLSMMSGCDSGSNRITLPSETLFLRGSGLLLSEELSSYLTLITGIIVGGRGVPPAPAMSAISIFNATTLSWFSFCIKLVIVGSLTTCPCTLPRILAYGSAAGRHLKDSSLAF